MASSDDIDDLVDGDDYYAWLGISRTASKDEVNNAFRKMSRIYHPDKHATKEMKEKAEQVFTKIKMAHEVLTDPHKRAIYDTMGPKGLETEGWEILPRTKTPQEILEEYERLQRAREEQRLQQRTNPKGTLSVGVDATDMFEQYESSSDDSIGLFPNLEITEMSISQSVECPLTSSDTAIISGNLSSHNGNGNGSVSVSVRRLLSHSGWAEIEFGVGSGMSFAMRGFRTLWQRGYGTVSGSLHVLPNGMIRPGVSAMVAHQFEGNVQCRLTLSMGSQSSLTSAVVWDKERHHLALILQVGIPHCFVALHYSNRFIEDDFKMKGAIRAGTFGMMVEYGCEKKITQFSHLGASIIISIPQGVRIKLKLNRGQQTFLMPIQLSESFNPSAILYGTVLPIAAYFIIKQLIVEPYLSQQKERDLQIKKEANIQRLSEKRRDAVTAIELMRETVERSYEIESSRNGLCIRQAHYGKVDDDSREWEKIDVTIPLQSLVKDSRLIISETTSLSELPGFYDPCVGENKELKVTYEFRHKTYTWTFKENDRIYLPSNDHTMVSDLVNGVS